MIVAASIAVYILIAATVQKVFHRVHAKECRECRDALEHGYSTCYWWRRELKWWSVTGGILWPLVVGYCIVVFAVVGTVKLVNSPATILANLLTGVNFKGNNSTRSERKHEKKMIDAARKLEIAKVLEAEALTRANAARIVEESNLLYIPPTKIVSEK